MGTIRFLWSKIDPYPPFENGFSILLPAGTNTACTVKVASSRLSWLVANPRIFRLFMKGNFDAYVLWLLDKMVQNWIVDRSTARDFTVRKFNTDISFHPLIKTHTLIFRKIPVFTEQWNRHKCILDLFVQDTLAQYN